MSKHKTAWELSRLPFASDQLMVIEERAVYADHAEIAWQAAVIESLRADVAAWTESNGTWMQRAEAAEARVRELEQFEPRFDGGLTVCTVEIHDDIEWDKAIQALTKAQAQMRHDEDWRQVVDLMYDDDEFLEVDLCVSDRVPNWYRVALFDEDREDG